ncbi:MAG: hypothetical protein HZA78_06345 [Candidatus Schekmanbacteria bacterium]|nr:hypothetical protein [Candidatus Schekmanbacteria bacterium]
MEKILLLIVIIPLMGAIIAPLLGQKKSQAAFMIALIAALLSWSLIVFLAGQVFSHGRISYPLGNWGASWGIELAADYLTVVLLLTVNSIGLLITIYSYSYIEKLLPEAKRRIYYYCLLCMLLAAMPAFLMAGDLFTMFVYLSLFSLAAVALIAIGRERQAILAGLRYLILSTTGGVLILLGIALLSYFTGTMNLNELTKRMAHITNVKPVLVAISIIIIGFGVKAALFPLHLWLPDAHGFAPSPISAILSGILIELGAYGILRCVFLLVQLKSREIYPFINNILCWMSVLAIIYGAVGAILQQDLKLILAYSSVSQIGYIVLGIALSSYYGLLGGMLHIINHAVMKSALFLSAGALLYKTDKRTLKELEGVGKQMPYSAGALALTGIAIVGIPPACGFVSEWYICMGAIQAGRMGFAICVLGGSFLSTIYYLRIINALYFKPVNGGKDTRVAINEAPLGMLVPIWILTFASLWLGIFNRWPLQWLEKMVAGIL